jgi:hypothetical protein
MENGFDLFTKIFAGEGSRREMIKRFGGLIGGASLLSAAACSEPTSPSRPLRAPGGPSLAVGSTPGRCRRNGHNCRENAECCSGYCDALTATCTCGPQSELCPATDTCVPACYPPMVFNAATCKCECGPGFETCGKGGVQGFGCCTTGYTRCCSNPSATGLDACCPISYSCCFGSLYTNCCAPGTKCCNAPSGYPTCCPDNSYCCVHSLYGYAYCSLTATCPA